MTGPEVPFPLREDPDRGIAEKYGFDPTHPFPLSETPREFTVSGQPMKRSLGKASYRADAIAGVVTITATGVAPNLNTTVELVQLPLMIWPPRFALYYLEPEIVLPATRPFSVSASFHTQEHLEAVMVQDRDGVHAVPVENF